MEPNQMESEMQVVAAILIALTLSVAPALAGDFEDGLNAYRSKDFANARQSWQKAAAQGNAMAHYLGLLV